MAWVKPTGYVDSGSVWGAEVLAYDGNTSSFAFVNCPAGWCDYLELTIAEISCDKVRVWMGIANTQVTEVEIDVYYGGWNNIYSGAIVTGSFQEFPIGSEQSVTAMRVRFFSTKKNRQAEIYEADFNEVGGEPTTYERSASISVGVTASAVRRLALHRRNKGWG